MMSHVIWQKGFRPFFLLGGLWAVGLVPWWVLHYDSTIVVDPLQPGLTGISWHSHEMIFGFTAAIIAGFLLTATENWTGRTTAQGPFLAVLAGLWLVGRGVGIGGPLGTIASLAELSFLPAVAIAVGLPILITQRSRNYLLLAILPLLWLCDAHIHLVASGLLPVTVVRGDLVAVDLIVLILIIVTARIVPLFTRNATGDQSIRSVKALDLSAVVSVILMVVVELFAPTGYLMAAVAAVSGVLVLARAVHWGTFKTLKTPILWVLHLGNIWIAGGLLIKAAAAASLGVQPSLATHALTVGAIGTLTVGMMARVTIGHTGRKIVSTPLMTLAFMAMTIGALVRVFVPMLRTDLAHASLLVSSGCWSLAFALYLIGNTSILLAPRPDGKQG